MKPALPSKWLVNVSVGDSVSSVARISLRTQLQAVLMLFPLAAERFEEDPEYIHLLRVWTRRATAAVQVFRSFMPKKCSRRVKAQLKRIRSAAGVARDFDVQIAKLKKLIRNSRQPKHRSSQRRIGSGNSSTGVTQDHHLQRWLTELVLKRKLAQRDLVRLYQDCFQNKQLFRLFQSLLAKIKPAPSSSADEFEVWARAKMQRQAEIFFEARPCQRADLKELHGFRIEAKNTRYTLELLSKAFPQDRVDPIYASIKKLQRLLGELNDHVVAIEQLQTQRNEAKSTGSKKMFRQMLKSRKEELANELARFRKLEFDGLVNQLQSGFSALLN